MTTPAENAATVREALIEWGTHLGQYGRRETCLTALDVLFAQAETAEMYKADRDEYDALLGRKMAERDAAIRAMEDAEAMLSATLAQPVYLENRELRRAAEQAQEALRQIAHLLRDARSRANTNLVFKAHRAARAALTGDSTWTQEELDANLELAKERAKTFGWDES